MRVRALPAVASGIGTALVLAGCGVIDRSGDGETAPEPEETTPAEAEETPAEEAEPDAPEPETAEPEESTAPGSEEAEQQDPDEADPEPGAELVDPTAFIWRETHAGEPVYGFQTPAGNICVYLLDRDDGMSEPGVDCYVEFNPDVELPERERSAEAEAEDDRDIVPIVTLRARGGEVFYGGVDDEFWPPEAVLEYGSTLEVEEVSCLAQEEAISCEVSDSWMRVSPRGYEFSSERDGPTSDAD